MFLRNVCWLSTAYTALRHRKQNSSQPPLWEPHILKYDGNRNISYLLKSSKKLQGVCYLSTFESCFIFLLDFPDVSGISATSRQKLYLGLNYLYITEKVHLSGNASGLYSGSARLESRPGRTLLILRVFIVLLSPSKQMPGWILPWPLPSTSFPNHYSLDDHSTKYIWITDSFRSRKPRLAAVGIRCADYVTPSIRKRWH
jgi:hypothetical protein